MNTNSYPELREKTDLPLRPIVLISRLLFAVFIVGFMGYLFDRMKQSLKQAIAH
jgi:hypothetical protein